MQMVVVSEAASGNFMILEDGLGFGEIRGTVPYTDHLVTPSDLG